MGRPGPTTVGGAEDTGNLRPTRGDPGVDVPADHQAGPAGGERPLAGQRRRHPLGRGRLPGLTPVVGRQDDEPTVHGIPEGLPSLLYTHKLLSKAASVGLDPGSHTEALDRITTAVTRLRAGHDDDLAQLLAATVMLARASGVDAESALRGWAARYRDHFEAMERLAAERGLDFATLDAAGVAALWLEVPTP